MRVGLGGILDAFEVTSKGPVGAQVELRLRVGDGWNLGPAVWSTTLTKVKPHTERFLIDVAHVGLVFGVGDTFVIEAQGNDTGFDLVGSHVNPASGEPNYPEEMYLSGPGCYDDCGWRIGFQAWMLTDTTTNYCVSLPNSTGAGATLSACPGQRARPFWLCSNG
ncbi:MAG: hypothetical protein GY711_05885 [bacterium]|nr:hypothetical protein [bacterium]